MTRQILTKTALSIALLSQSACSDGRLDTTSSSLPLTAFVAHQSHQSTTDLIDVEQGIELDRLEFGWEVRGSDVHPERAAALIRTTGRIGIFSADRDLQSLILNARLDADPGLEGHPFELRLNGRRLGSITATGTWGLHEVDVPKKLVRRGRNTIRVTTEASSPGSVGASTTLLVRGIRFRSAGREPVPIGRQRHIRLGRENDSSVVEMPTSSYLDLVLEIPAEGKLVGEFRLQEASTPTGTVDVYLRLLDEDDGQHELLRERLDTSDRSAHLLAVDLRPWTGQLVRLRLGVTGRPDACVQWTNVAVHGRDPALAEALFRPTDRAQPASNWQLGRPDILILLLDAARADAFAPYGGPYPTPAADQLAAQGTVFEQALAPSPWTGQSVPALLTGLYGETLGVGPWGFTLPETVPTMAELMRSAGYRTVLWSQHPIYFNRWSFKRGFDETYRAPRGHYETVPAIEHLHSSERPTFALVHLMPPHTPYSPPSPFLGRYSDWYQGTFPVDARSLNQFSQQGDPDSLSAQDLRFVRDRYQENVAFADHLTKQVLDLLQSNEQYDKTLIVLLSDHGEGFYEHGRFLHTKLLHTEFLRIPLIVKWPDSLPRYRQKVTEPVSLIDILPTLIDGLAVAEDGPGFQGRSLLQTVSATTDLQRALYAQTIGVSDRQRLTQPSMMLQDGEWRYLYNPVQDRGKLFNVIQDPFEREDLSRALPGIARLMRQSLLMQSTWNLGLLETGDKLPDLEPLDPTVEEDLKALGYLD